MTARLGVDGLPARGDVVGATPTGARVAVVTRRAVLRGVLAALGSMARVGRAGVVVVAQRAFVDLAVAVVVLAVTDLGAAAGPLVDAADPVDARIGGADVVVVAVQRLAADALGVPAGLA